MKILNWKIEKVKPLDLEKIFNEHKYEFETLLVKDFIGYIPKEINEPTLKVFREFGEQFEKWTLWQSWYINHKAIRDPLKITFYDGMMVYLKVLNTMAKTNKKSSFVEAKGNIGDKKVEAPYIDAALSGIEEFKNNVNKNYKANQDTENQTA